MTEVQFSTLMSRIAEGDRKALQEIYEEYMPYIYSVIFNVLKNKENAEDVCSDFFIKLMSFAGKYNSGNGHKGYMATIARNMSIDYLRKYGREDMIADFEMNMADDDSEGGISGKTMLDISENSPEDQVVSDLSVKEAIEELPPPEPEIINLKIMGELTFKEIASILKLPMGTVTWHYAKAINSLRRFGYA